jgi:hypothetical protein
MHEWVRAAAHPPKAVDFALKSPDFGLFSLSAPFVQFP